MSSYLDGSAPSGSAGHSLGARSPARHYVARLFDRVRDEYPAARLLNRSACMATAADLLAQQVPDAVLERPHLVTLSVGPNDVRRGFSAQDFARRVEVILERLQCKTEASVVVNLLPDMAFCRRFSTAEGSLVSAMTPHYNHALQHVADGFGWSSWTSASPTDPTMNDAGSSVTTATIPQTRAMRRGRSRSGHSSAR